VSLNEIVERLPSFVNRILENTYNRILVYYGDYIIDHIYDINDFISNTDICKIT